MKLKSVPSAIIAAAVLIFMSLACGLARAGSSTSYLPSATASPALAPGAALGSNGAPLPYTPAQIQSAYGLNSLAANGAGQTIAIVDPYHDAAAFSDLNTFSATFGLPQFNLAGGTSSAPGLPTFTQVSTTVPDGSGVWALETALDIEWAHVMAPMANITLVEATDDGAGFYAAVNTAKALPGVSVVSMSWGGAEVPGQIANDPTFTTPAGKLANNQGVTFVAATGDYGSPPNYPATSPNVVGVGGTSLVLAATTNARVSETAWSSSNGGLSSVYAQPSFQANVTNLAGTASRASPDVAFLADPNPGVYVYDSVPRFGQSGPWWHEGGTSLGAPAWSGLIADADALRTSEGLGTLDGASQTLPALYSLPATDFFDITTGSNKTYSAGPEYDLVTGLGTPNAAQLVPDLANYGVTAAPEPPTLILALTAAVVALGIARARVVI